MFHKDNYESSRLLAREEEERHILQLINYTEDQQDADTETLHFKSKGRSRFSLRDREIQRDRERESKCSFHLSA